MLVLVVFGFHNSILIQGNAYLFLGKLVYLIIKNLFQVLDPIDGTKGFLKGTEALYVVGYTLLFHLKFVSNYLFYELAVSYFLIYKFGLEKLIRVISIF